MVVLCHGYKSGRYEKLYRGVFESPLDYIFAVSDENLSRVRESVGEPLTERQKRSRSRLEELEELGGIDEGVLNSGLFTSAERDFVMRHYHERVQ